MIYITNCIHLYTYIRPDHSQWKRNKVNRYTYIGWLALGWCVLYNIYTSNPTFEQTTVVLECIWTEWTEQNINRISNHHHHQHHMFGGDRFAVFAYTRTQLWCFRACYVSIETKLRHHYDFKATSPINHYPNFIYSSSTFQPPTTTSIVATESLSLPPFRTNAPLNKSQHAIVIDSLGACM